MFSFSTSRLTTFFSASFDSVSLFQFLSSSFLLNVSKMSASTSSASVPNMDINKNHSTVKYVSARTAKELSKIHKYKDYYYIKSGDFDIVWVNVSIFTIGHLLYFWGLWTLYSQTLIYTWIYSEWTPTITILIGI